MDLVFQTAVSSTRHFLRHHISNLQRQNNMKGTDHQGLFKGPDTEATLRVEGRIRCRPARRTQRHHLDVDHQDRYLQHIYTRVMGRLDLEVTPHQVHSTTSNIADTVHCLIEHVRIPTHITTTIAGNTLLSLAMKPTPVILGITGT